MYCWARGPVGAARQSTEAAAYPDPPPTARDPGILRYPTAIEELLL